MSEPNSDFEGWFVYQAHHLLPEFSAENVAMPLRLQGASATESARVAGDLLIEIGHRKA